MVTMPHEQTPAPAPYAPRPLPVPGRAPFVTAEHVLVRFNLHPSDALVGDPRWRAAADAVRDAVEQRAALEPSVSDELYHLGGAVDADVRRRWVLPVRRAVHHGQRPDAAATERLLAIAPLPYLRAWLDLDDVVADALRALDRGYDDELARERAALREVLTDPDVSRSFAVASPDMLRAAAGYAATTTPSKSQRKSEPNLLKHSLRATLKTSPFSRYTATALGWRVQGPAVGTGPAGRARTLPLPVSEVSSSVETSHLLVRRLLRLAQTDPRLRDHLPVHLAPHLVHEVGRVRFHVDVPETSSAARVDARSQQEVSLPDSPAVLSLVDLVGRAGGSLTPRQLVDALAGRGLQPAAAEAFVERLLSVGLLVVVDPVPEQTDDALGEAAAALAGTGTGLGRSLAQRLLALQDPIASFSLAGGAERVALAARIDAAWRELYAELSAEPPGGTLCYEDTCLDRPVDVPDSLVDGAALSRAADLMTLFDDHCLLRRLVRSAVVEQVGPGGTVEDVVDFAPAMADMLRRSWDLSTRSVGDDSASAGDLGTDVTDLLALRARILLDITRRAVGDHEDRRPPVEHDVVLDADVERWCASAPEALVARPASYDLFVQPDAESGLGFVNKVYGGWSQFTSRFLRYFGDEARERIAAGLRACFDDDVRLLQLRPVLGFNANLHPLVFDGDLDVDDRDGELPGHDLRIEDLSLRHDLATDEVVVEERATGRRVEVFYLGFLVPYLLPYHQSLFYVLNGCGQVYFRPFREHEQVSRRQEPDAVRAYPRVRLGDVVLLRRRWYLSRDLVPTARGDEDDAAFFARVQRWRGEHRVPAQVFVLPDDAAEADGMIPFLKSVTRVKPAPLDLSSPVQVKAMRRWFADADPVVVLEEAAPGPTGGLATDVDDQDTAPHATELVVEVTRSARTAARPAPARTTRSRARLQEVPR